MSVRIVQKDLPVKGKRWVIEDHELGWFCGFDVGGKRPLFRESFMVYSFAIKSEAEEFARRHAMEVEE